MAYLFDGTNDYIEAAGARGIATSFPISIAAWYITPTSSWSTAEGICVISDDDSNPGLLLLISLNGTVGAQTRNNSGAVGSLTATAANIVANKWTHVAGVFPSANSRTAYADGVPGAVNNTTSTFTASTLADINIGRAKRTTADIFAKGRVAEVGFWNAVLTQDEITALAKGVSPSKIRPQSLFFYAPLIREPIELRNGSPLTVSGPTVAEHVRRIG